MRKLEFHDLGQFEEVKNELARASQHPVYTDLSQNIDDEGNPRGEQLGDLEQVPGRNVVWNNRDNRPAYYASEKYELSQHREVLDLIQEAINGTTGSIKMGMVRDYGEQIDGLVVFDTDNATIDVSDLVGDGYIPPEGDVDPQGNARARDTLGLGMRFQNSFDGSTRIQGETMGYRFICQNWLVWGKETIGVDEQLHISKLDASFFADLILEVFDTKDEASGIIVDAEDDEIPLDWVPGILRQVGFGRNYVKRICQHLNGYNAPQDGHTTAWRLYNAVTYELDHNTVDRAGAGVYDDHQRRAEKILNGSWNPPEEEVEFAEVIA